ncbi:MAG: radical SAM protein [Eubacteriales bacterium]|nr:radical SAM protein [Eubacteriales bacterium]
MGIKIVLTAPASSYVHCALAPWCLKSGVEKYAKNKFEISIVDLTINEAEEKAAQKIIAEAPDCVGFGCYIWNISFIQKLAKIIKQKLPSCKIAIGGPEVSEDIQDAFEKLPEADFLLRGEGEIPFAKLADALANNESDFNIDGVCGKDRPYAEVFSSDFFPSYPYSKEYFDKLNGRISYIETSRGCPFSCSFCLSGKKERVKFLPMEQSQKAILQLAGGSSQTIKFVDRTFNANIKRAKQIISFIIDKTKEGLIPSNKCFHFEVAADLLDAETIGLFEQAPAGLFQIEAGIQSINTQTLNAIYRKTNTEKVCDALKQVIQCNTVHVHVDLIAGLPYEDLKSFIDGFNKVFRLHPHALQLGFLKILQGSKLKEQAEEYGIHYSKTPPYQVQYTKWLSERDVAVLTKAEHALELLYNRQRFVNTVIYLTEKLCKPFDLFYALGEIILAQEKQKQRPLSLDELTEAVFHALIEKFPDRAMEIKNYMLLDRLSFVATSSVPHYLRDYNSKLNELKRKINKIYPMEDKIHRAFAIIKQGEEPYIFWADYKNRHPVTKSYDVNRLPVKEIL